MKVGVLPGTDTTPPHLPFFRITTKSLKHPALGTKNKNQALAYGLVNPPAPPLWDPDDLAHPPGIAPTANIPRNMVS